MEKWIPYRTYIEDEAPDQFHSIYSSENASNKDGEFLELAEGIFDVVCGRYGRETFLKKTLPNLLTVYGSNYRAAGDRILNVIDTAGDASPDKIDSALASAISEEELSFASPEQRVADRNQVVERLWETLRQCESSEPRDLIQIEGIVLYGSVAQAKQRVDSDVDLTWIVRETQDRNTWTEVQCDKIDRFLVYLNECCNSALAPRPIDDFVDPIWVSNDEFYLDPDQIQFLTTDDNHPGWMILCDNQNIMHRVDQWLWEQM